MRATSFSARRGRYDRLGDTKHIVWDWAFATNPLSSKYTDFWNSGIELRWCLEIPHFGDVGCRLEKPVEEDGDMPKWKGKKIEHTLGHNLPANIQASYPISFVTPVERSAMLMQTMCTVRFMISLTNILNARLIPRWSTFDMAVVTHISKHCWCSGADFFQKIKSRIHPTQSMSLCEVWDRSYTNFRNNVLGMYGNWRNLLHPLMPKWKNGLIEQALQNSPPASIPAWYIAHYP